MNKENDRFATWFGRIATIGLLVVVGYLITLALIILTKWAWGAS